MRFDFEPGMHSHGVGGLSLSYMGTQITGVEKLYIVETNYVGTWVKGQVAHDLGRDGILILVESMNGY